MSSVFSWAAVAATLLTGAAAVEAQSLATDVKACRLLTATAERLRCYDAMQLPVETGMPAAAAPAAAPPVVVDPVSRFGQEAIRSTAGTPELKRIESRIRGRFQGWGPNSQLTLENGQVWRIADGSEAFYDLQDPKATVHRGLLGAFFLEVQGVGFNVRVTRVR